MNLQANDCPNHVQIDLYLLGSDEGRLSWIRDHLEKCPTCRYQADRRRADFASYAKALQEPAEIIPALEFRFKPWRSDDQQDDPSVRLAAQGQSNEAVQTSLTMISTDQQIMMKVLRDRQTQDIWLYLLSEQPELCRHALVFPFKLEQGYVTDAEGKVNLGDLQWPTEMSMTAEVRLPSATFQLAPLVDLEQGKPQLIESINGDILKVTYHSDGEYRRMEIQIVELHGLTTDSPLRLAVCERDSTHLQVLNPVQSRELSVGGIQGASAITLYLYQ